MMVLTLNSKVARDKMQVITGIHLAMHSCLKLSCENINTYYKQNLPYKLLTKLHLRKIQN